MCSFQVRPYLNIFSHSARPRQFAANRCVYRANVMKKNLQIHTAKHLTGSFRGRTLALNVRGGRLAPRIPRPKIPLEVSMAKPVKPVPDGYSTITANLV